MLTGIKYLSDSSAPGSNQRSGRNESASSPHICFEWWSEYALSSLMCVSQGEDTSLVTRSLRLGIN